MKPDYLTPENINRFIDAALLEDVGSGDHTSLASIPENSQNQARLIIKEKGIIAGLEMASYIFKRVDPSIRISDLIREGQHVEPGSIGFKVQGSARSLLTAERLVLNCLQRMSGIASYTRKLVDMISHTRAKILDTRKTTPNFRLAEKWAVFIGGGWNHRFGLYDMILLKDNHVDFSGGIRPAIQNTKAYLKAHNLSLKIEVETRNLEEIEEVLREGGVDIIMLDNMDPGLLEEAVKLIDQKYITEASGNINENTIIPVAESGVDYISVGALTHSVKSMDISLKAFQ